MARRRPQRTRSRTPGQACLRKVTTSEAPSAQAAVLLSTAMLKTSLLAVAFRGAIFAQTMAFTVSMPQPANHTLHVARRAEGLPGEIIDFKMPQWSPGYYRILDYARNVSKFRAEDAQGHPLAWEKTTKNTWRVAAGNVNSVLLNYDV